MNNFGGLWPADKASGLLISLPGVIQDKVLCSELQMFGKKTQIKGGYEEGQKTGLFP